MNVIDFKIKLPEEFQTVIEQSVVKAIHSEKLLDHAPQYLTKKEAAKYLHVSNNTLSKWIEHDIVHPIVIDGIIRFQRTSLDNDMSQFQK